MTSTTSKPNAAERGLRKRSPTKAELQPLEVRVYVELTRVQDALWNDFLPLFERHGLTHQQYNVLRILRGGEARGLPCQAIGERMVYRSVDVTRLVDRLAAAGWVERARIAGDRRVVLVKLTQRGRGLLVALDQPVLELHRAQLAHMKKTELETLRRLLRKANTRA